jgi:chaperone BCS1
MGARSAAQKITLSGLLNFIDGLWSTSGEERIIIFTTIYKDRLDRALLRPGRMDMHVYMGYCGWEAFKTLAHNYFLIDDNSQFPEIQELLSAVEVTPAEVSEMLLRRGRRRGALGCRQVPQREEASNWRRELAQPRRGGRSLFLCCKL